MRYLVKRWVILLLFHLWKGRECILEVKVPLWRKLHLFYRGHFKTETSSMHEKKNPVYYFQISLFVPAKKDISDLSQFVSKMFDSLQYKDSTKGAPQFELNSYVTMVTYWVTDLIFKAFLAPIGIPFSCLQMVPRIHDPTSVFRAENHLHIEIKWVGTGKEWVAMARKCFLAVGVFSVELLAYQVSFNCTANWPR